ncbi:pimeloyl-ACP methyl ester carboxylesterase [Sphingomonas vulcanisoli]|uniref:Pimeloyl-ACP methyl ester carboxylesterase n=1 Tax=Sphingomonas vulcanisoli TaxID=1658060 RepID=A0ABX0TZT9_9SPHN|nr:alpha/beta hydrolase [Sphingomonas vulcanisoli]NIJ09265.1 pimeloyl-ACP methyl ester carboxylesterase [Sphingomonas vulcanisoli]
MTVALAAERITIGGVGLEVRRWPGVGTPILLLHEGLGSVSMWRDFPGRLAAATGRPVIAWSRQGYGASDPLPDPREPAYMHDEARWVPLVMDALDIPRAVLLGHSDGGSIALLAAAWFPERVAALILEAPHVFVERLTVDSIAKVKQVYLTTDLGTKLGRHHRDAQEVFWRWNDIWLDPRFEAWNIEEWLPSIEAPALLIQGLDDEYGTLEQLDRIEAVLPRTTRVELANCGHSPHRDQFDAVLAACLDFLKDDDLG